MADKPKIVEFRDFETRFLISSPETFNSARLKRALLASAATRPARRPKPRLHGVPNSILKGPRTGVIASKPGAGSAASAITAQLVAGGVMCDDSDTEPPSPMQAFYRRNRLVFRCGHSEPHEFIVRI